MIRKWACSYTDGLNVDWYPIFFMVFWQGSQNFNSVEILGDLAFGDVFRCHIKSMTHERINLSSLKLESYLRKTPLRERKVTD